MQYGINDERGPSKDVPDRKNPEGRFEDCEGARGLDFKTSSNIPESKKEDAMLVLGRKLNEKIVIDGGIVVTVVKIDRNQIRLGNRSALPSHVRVFREEIAGTTLRAPLLAKQLRPSA